MNTKHFISRICILAALVVLVLGFATGSASATSAGTAFTYQGQLIQGGSPVTASCDFKFSLYDALARGNQVGSTNSLTGVTVANGLFTVQLDFGTTAFKGEARWLEIAVKCGSETLFSTLAPRQPLTPAPYALYTNTATNFSGALTGDANGLQDSTHVTALRGIAIAATTPTNGQVLQYTGSWWEATSALAGLWSLTGNSGTNPATNFVGTLDNVALEFRVNNSRALRLEPNATSPNIIGGYSGNSVTNGVYAAVIGGGGELGLLNRVTDIFGVVSGGADNLAGDDAGTISDASYATIGGGGSNNAKNGYATVGGGSGNTASGYASTVGGGVINVASGYRSTVGGGAANASSDYATVGGGFTNTASGVGAFIGGGGYDGSTYSGNTAAASAATIGGGLGNQITSNGSYAVISGGYANTASGAGAFIGGGGWDGTAKKGNTAAANASTIAGGYGNQIVSNANYATISGGYDNYATGIVSTICGGDGNSASGAGAFIGGGGWDGTNNSGNVAAANASTIAGGWGNQVTSAATFGTVCGGNGNTASGYTATIGGGYGNTASAVGAFIGGGGYNGDVNGNTAAAMDATIGGGWGNQVTSQGEYATIGGGYGNTASGAGAFIGGGGYDGNYDNANTAAGNASTIAGGTGNQITYASDHATIGGGDGNTANMMDATVGGGDHNTASGDSATVGGGARNNASYAYATVPGGYDASATHYGEMAHASGYFANAGDAQTSEYVLRNTTTGADGTELFLDGTSSRLTLASHHTLSFDILVVAHSDSWPGAAAGYQITGLIENTGSAIYLVADPVVTVLGADPAASLWYAHVNPDSSDHALQIWVSGGAAGMTIRWVASVRTVDVGW